MCLVVLYTPARPRYCLVLQLLLFGEFVTPCSKIWKIVIPYSNHVFRSRSLKLNIWPLKILWPNCDSSKTLNPKTVNCMLQLEVTLRILRGAVKVLHPIIQFHFKFPFSSVIIDFSHYPNSLIFPILHFHHVIDLSI